MTLTDTQWQTSKRGNQWRRYRGLTLTVFLDSRRTPRYKVAVSDSNGPSYSQRSFLDVDQAKQHAEDLADIKRGVAI